MRSPTSSEDSRLVRIVVPCAQTRLPRPRGHRDAFSSSSERRKRRAFRQACSAGHRASSEARGDVCSLSWSGGRFDVRASYYSICVNELDPTSGPFVRISHVRMEMVVAWGGVSILVPSPFLFLPPLFGEAW